MARVIPRRNITNALFEDALEFDMFESSEPAGLQPTKKGTPGTVSGFQPSGGIASTAGAELPQEDKGAMESETCIQPVCDTSIGPTAKKQQIEPVRCRYLSGAIAHDKESTAPAAPFSELLCHPTQLREYDRPHLPSEHSEDYTPTSYENDLDGGTYESDLEAEAVLRERELEDQREEWSLGFSIDSDGHWHEHQRSPIYQTSPPLTKEEVDDIRESLEAGNAAAMPATGAATTTSLSSIMYCG